MKLIQVASHVLSAVSATVLLTVIGANQAQALSEVQLPANFAIENANNRSMVVDKFGDNPSTAAKAHQYSKENPRTYTLFANRSSNGSYEVHLASAPNLCFTMAGGLNPNQGNGTLAVFSGDCNNSLNLRFFDDGTVRVARNTNLCLTNQGNRFNTMFNKLHFWACDGSAETKFNFAAVGGVNNNAGVVYTPPVVTQQYNPPSNTPSSNPIVEDGIRNELNVTYTAVLISARAGAVPNQPVKVGHTTFAMVKRFDLQYSARYKDGTVRVFQTLNNQKEVTTVSSPGYEANSTKFNSVVVDNYGMDLPLVEKWLKAGNLPRLDGYSFRTIQVDAEGYRRAVPKSKGGYNTTYRGLLCGLYSVTTQWGCNCTTVAARIFTNVTKEDFESNWNPTGLAQAIDQKNQLGDWVDGGVGRTWFVTP
jgi:hypothetical protein